MEYKIRSLELKNNIDELYGTSNLPNQCIIVWISFAVCSFVPKWIKITISRNQPLFFKLKELFANIEQNEHGDKVLRVNDYNFPQPLKNIIKLTTLTVNLKDTYYKINKTGIDCDEDGMPTNITSIPILTIKHRLHEDSDEIMYPIGTPEEIKNTHLKRKYILATEYNKKV